MQADHVVPLICMWRESRGNPEAYEAVAWCMVNRMRDTKGRWPRTLTGVALQPTQFSSFNKGDANSLLFPDPKNKLSWASFEKAAAALEFVLYGRNLDANGVTIPAVYSVDPTKGANHYHDHSITVAQVSWLKTEANAAKYRTATIGPFDFYKL